MIFGHHFDFQNEPILQQEYLFFSSQSSYYSGNKAIKVIEVNGNSLLDTFSLKTKFIEMSGQEVRYLSHFPAVSMDLTSSWGIEIKKVLTLLWDAQESKILYLKGENYTPKRLQFWIYHTFFPLVLELQRMYRILHVGSVEINGKPVLFSAPSYGGKSTMTDYFIKKGHTMLSDDSLAIDEHGDKYYAIASYPFHRPYRKVETLGYPVKKFATEPKPLHAVYLLEKNEPDAAVEINEVKGIEKFKAFHYSSFIDFSFMKKARFDFFTKMAKHVPVYQVKVPWDLERLSEVYEAIVSNAKE